MPDLTVECPDPGDPGGSGLGVTVENVVVVNSTTITCDVVISQTAQIGLRQVKVEHEGGMTNNETFRVGYPSDFLVFFG